MAAISVIVPVYKVEPYLRRCVDSILAQTFEDFEVILVDDGSPDNCGAICDAYAAKDERVQVIHQQNQGQGAARNHALDWVFANSDSNYIGFVDSDDWVHPRYLELLLEGFRQHDVNICQCGYMEIDGTGAAPEVSGSFSCITPEEQYLNHYSAFMWDKLFARTCWEKMRFPEGQIYEDVAIWYRMLFREKRIALVEEALYYYYVNPDSTVRKDWTPAHFARIRAWDATVSFLTDYGNQAVLTNAVYRYCHIAKKQYDEIGRSRKASAAVKHRYQARIKYRMFRMLTRYKKEMVDNGSYLYFFEWLFPLLGTIYWTYKGISEKLRMKKRQGR